jgi:hypothetical protein
MAREGTLIMFPPGAVYFLTASAGLSGKQLTKIKDWDSILSRSFNTIWPELAIECNADWVNSALRLEMTQMQTLSGR